jgi:hypothetical protein
MYVGVIGIVSYWSSFSASKEISLKNTGLKGWLTRFTRVLLLIRRLFACKCVTINEQKFHDRCMRERSFGETCQRLKKVIFFYADMMGKLLLQS